MLTTRFRFLPPFSSPQLIVADAVEQANSPEKRFLTPFSAQRVRHADHSLSVPATFFFPAAYRGGCG
jgi:hypothetical protein